MPKLSLVFLFGLLSACASAVEPEPRHPDSPPADLGGDDDDGMAVEGLRGSLRRDEVDPVMNRAARRFQQCYIDAFEDHPYLAGELSLEFTVAPDGSVRQVWAPQATLGSHDVEECILAIARSLTFPRPHGGEADFDYGPLEMAASDGHHFDTWSLAQLEEQADEVRQAFTGCTDGLGGYQATLYVGPGGRVRSIGATAPAATALDGARCLERTLSVITYPDPGTGRVAKLTLEL